MSCTLVGGPCSPQPRHSVPNFALQCFSKLLDKSRMENQSSRLWTVHDEKHVGGICIAVPDSITHFKCITAFKALHHQTSLRAGAHTHFIDVSMIYVSTMCLASFPGSSTQIGRAWYVFSREHDIMEKDQSFLEQKGSILHIVQPTLHSMLGACYSPT